MTTLQAKKSTFTKNIILVAATELTDKLDINDLSFKKVSEQAGISERTMFRHFSTRDDFLDALAAELHSQLQLPPMPGKTEGLFDYVAQLYKSLDAQPRRVHILLDAQLLPRIVNTTSKMRFEELIALLKRQYPQHDNSVIKRTAANMRYVMSASSWRYYREMFGFDLPESIECANMVVRQTLDFLNDKLVI